MIKFKTQKLAISGMANLTLSPDATFIF